MTLWQLLQSDLYRVDAKQGVTSLVTSFLRNPSFRYTALFRLCQHCKGHALLRLTLRPLLIFWYARLGIKYGIRIPLLCQIGPGLLIEHWGGIWVNAEVVIGANCNLCHNVTLGLAGREGQKGTPRVGDNVFIGPGSMALGNIQIGNGAVITANSVALDDIPENGVLMGNPGRVFSRQGSRGLQKNLVVTQLGVTPKEPEV